MAAALHLTDDERFPLMDTAGRALLDRLREHPHAPRYNMRCGDRLTEAGRERVREFERALRASPPGWRLNEPPAWARDFADRCMREVPLYRRGAVSSQDWSSIPTVERHDVVREPWSFAPDDEPLDDLIVYYTAGTSGHPMDVLSHPETASKRLPLYRAALAAHGVELRGGSGRTAIAFVCSQAATLTYASLSFFLEGAAHVKVNLNPAEWRSRADRELFLDDLDPEIYTGDPLSLLDLADLPLSTKPRAIITSAMQLRPETRRHIEERFECPVVDIYSTCESGPIAFAVGSGFRILPNDLYVEIIDAEGRTCPPGVRGEIALTGGRNPFLPLLRYRTGDWASMSFEDGAPILRDFEGRAPVVFLSSNGAAINNLDVTTALRPFAFAQFALHQNADGSLVFRHRGARVADDAITIALRSLFGDTPVRIEPIPDDAWKVVPYSRD
jgi:phenylacetate-CoA ligase